MNQSPELTEFYREYQKWIDAGAPVKDPIFERGMGLCPNLRMYIFEMCGMYEVHIPFSAEMKRQFIEAGLDPDLPFNSKPMWSTDYQREANQDTCYLNPERLKWVKEHCK